MEWINVNEQLPTKGTPVLVVAKDRQMYVAWIEAYGEKEKPIWQYSWCCGCFCDGITHWAPLPEGPKNEKT